MSEVRMAIMGFIDVDPEALTSDGEASLELLASMSRRFPSIYNLAILKPVGLMPSMIRGVAVNKLKPKSRNAALTEEREFRPLEKY